MRTKSEIVRKNPASRGTPPAFGRSRSSTIIEGIITTNAAQQIGCTEPEIAKTLFFIVEEKPVIVVMARDGKVNSSKFKSVFRTKPHMIPREQVVDITGFQPGGVCPFAVPNDIPIWLDVSMKRFEYVHPAGGNEFTSVKITPDELEKIAGSQGWCDVCKGWEE